MDVRSPLGVVAVTIQQMMQFMTFALLACMHPSKVTAAVALAATQMGWPECQTPAAAVKAGKTPKTGARMPGRLGHSSDVETPTTKKKNVNLYQIFVSKIMVQDLECRIQVQFLCRIPMHSIVQAFSAYAIK